ncbi:MAG: hypothetical protein NXH87_17280 [Rhodobiaceae bacterium]|nr:hypothetical protein [Rhodobiaceae bacterium]
MELDTNLIATVAASVLALMMGWFGLRIMAERIKAKGLGPYNLQGLGLVLLLPTILMLLVVSDEMPTEVIATLLGGVAGYIFGRGDDKPPRPPAAK